MRLADMLIGLHDCVADDIDAAFAGKLQVVLQSAIAPVTTNMTVSEGFDICQVGHLREEKDPLRAAYAVRELPSDSCIRVIHAGRAHTEDWARQAEREQAQNPRYRWHGQLQQEDVWALMASSRAMVISSVSEGGANVVSEACVAGLPILASRIPGNTGLLGLDYPGYFPVGDTSALRILLRRLETDTDFYQQLREHCQARAPLFSPEAEQAALERAIQRSLKST